LDIGSNEAFDDLLFSLFLPIFHSFLHAYHVTMLFICFGV
jgi:hypothetical protein